MAEFVITAWHLSGYMVLTMLGLQDRACKVVFFLALAACTRRAPEKSSADAAVASSAPTIASALSATPPNVASAYTVTGVVKRTGCDAWMPGTKDPKGKTSTSCDVIAGDVTIDPPLPGGATLIDAVVIDDAPMTVSTPSFGKCTTTLSQHTKIANDFIVDIFEPGCNTRGIYDKKGAIFGKGFVATAKAKLKTGEPIDLTIAIATPPKAISPAAKPFDTSDWKDAPAGSTIDLRWTVDQTKGKPSVKATKDPTKVTVPLELTLAVAGHSHSLKLEVNAAPPNSNPCGSVSFFWADTNIWIQVARAEGGRAVLVREDVPATGPTRNRQLFAFDVPAGAKVSQEVVTIDPDGKRTSTKCTAASLP